jgi:hypothetical protein
MWNKLRSRALIKLFITISLLHDFECGTLSNNSSYGNINIRHMKFRIVVYRIMLKLLYPLK